jgi:hypothetical protein
MRPYVILRYRFAEAWTRGPSAAIADGPTLENTSPITAYDVRISEIALDDESRYRFPIVGPLRSHEARPLEPGAPPQASSLTKVISRDVVRRVLAGQPPVTKWPVRITYRSELGHAYVTCCEIRVVRLPLEICSAVVRCPHDAGGEEER